MLPGRPVGNMYFAAWSHNVIANTVNLSNDLKLGEYRKYPQPFIHQPQTNSTISQNPSSCHVPYPSIRYYLGRFRQLCCDDIHRE